MTPTCIIQQPINAVLAPSIADEGPGPRESLNKRQKQALKHENLLRRKFQLSKSPSHLIYSYSPFRLSGLEVSRSPYSKSHGRRVKRKSKEQVASGLADIQTALDEVETEMPPAVRKTIGTDDADDPGDQHKVRRSMVGQIGEGKGVPLSRSQRKRAL